MESFYNALMSETLHTLEMNKVWILATSADDLTTARSISLVNIGLRIFFQTHASFTKYQQIEKNKNTALCCKNIQIQAEAIIRGRVSDDCNDKFRELYRRVHASAFQRYSKLEGQVLIEIVPKIITFWKYIDGIPFKDILDIDNKKALRKEQMYIQ